MRSIPVAMTWEMLQRGRWSLIACFFGAHVLPTMMFSLFRQIGVDFKDPSLTGVYAVLILTNMFLFAVAAISSLGSPSRLYAFPIPTHTLVAWQIFPAMAIVIFEMCLSTSLLNAAFDLDWPIWGPALFAGVAVGAIQSTLWFTEKSAWMPLAMAAISGILGTWYHFRFCQLLGQPTHLWVAVTPVEVTTLLAVSAASYYVGVVAVARNRCGEQIKPVGILAWIERLFDLNPILPPLFRTRLEAQFWFEWRKKGWAMPGIVIFVIPFVLIFWAFFVRDPKELIAGFVAGGALLSIVGMIGGVIFGNLGAIDSDYVIGHFLASRPLTNTELAHIVLKVVAKSIVFAWIIWATSFFVAYGTLRVFGFTPEQYFPKELGWWYFPVTLLSCWAAVAVTTSACLTGRLNLFARIICAGIAMYLVLVGFSAYALSHEATRQMFDGIVVMCAIGIVLGTAGLFIAAQRQRMIGLPTVTASAIIWGVLVSAGLFESLRHPVAPFATYFFIFSLAALPLAPLAAAPLAVAWNRNR